MLSVNENGSSGLVEGEGELVVLSPVQLKFILHWGEMGTRWGVNRSVAQIHALLFISAMPLHAEAICACLGIARSNVSNSLKELQNWNLIKTVHMMGDRRDYFDTSKEVWVLFNTIMEERKRREFDPTLVALRECVDEAKNNPIDADAYQKMLSVLEFMQVLSAWLDEMKRLSPDTLMALFRMGARVKKALAWLSRK